MIRAGIIGAAGYTAGELIRLLLNHPEAELVAAESRSHAGKPLTAAHPDLIGETDLRFTDALDPAGTDVIFLCSGHGKSREAFQALPPAYPGAVIDLSNDFRLAADAGDFVYGLPEAYRDRIAASRHIANPGCFATATQLALLPLAAADLLGEIHVTALTGSTGAGATPSPSTHFSNRSDNISVYKAFTHQHLGEILQTLHDLAPGFGGALNFVPMRGCFARGIFASVYLDCPWTEEEADAAYRTFYRDAPFVHVTEADPDLKLVVNTNKCVLQVRKHGRKLHIVSVIDNLLKGASGQAVQNMNLVFGLDETAGLRLKPSRF